jgi:hypothetical protein
MRSCVTKSVCVHRVWGEVALFVEEEMRRMHRSMVLQPLVIVSALQAAALHWTASVRRIVRCGCMRDSVLICRHTQAEVESSERGRSSDPSRTNAHSDKHAPCMDDADNTKERHRYSKNQVTNSSRLLLSEYVNTNRHELACRQIAAKSRTTRKWSAVAGTHTNALRLRAAQVGGR